MSNMMPLCLACGQLASSAEDTLCGHCGQKLEAVAVVPVDEADSGQDDSRKPLSDLSDFSWPDDASCAEAWNYAVHVAWVSAWNQSERRDDVSKFLRRWATPERVRMALDAHRAGRSEVVGVCQGCRNPLLRGEVAWEKDEAFLCASCLDRHLMWLCGADEPPPPGPGVTP